MLVFILYYILFFIILLSLVLLLSSLRVSVKNVNISNKEYDELKIDFDELWKYIDIDFSIKLELYFLNIIKIFKYTFNKEKVLKTGIDEKIKRMDYDELKKEIEVDFDAEIINKIKKVDIKMKEFDLKLKIGTKSPIISSYLVAIISMIFSVFLSKIIKKVEPKKHKYSINPLYLNRNTFNIKLNCIFYTNLVHIIYIVFIFLRKRRVKIYERTSNRRFNDNSNEQYSRYGRCKYNNRGANSNI